MYNDLSLAVEDFSFNSSQIHLAVKTGISCALAVYACYWLEIQHAYWAGITTIIMMQPHASATLTKGIMRTCGACAGSYLSLFFASICVNNHFFFNFASLFILVMAFYLGNRARYGYFWSYGLSHVVLITMIVVMSPYEMLPEHIAFARSAAIAVGATASILVNVVLWPPASDPANVHAAPEKTTEKDEDFLHISLLRWDLMRLHVPTLKHSVKGGLGIIMVFWIWQWFQIPGGGLNMSTAVITVLQQDFISSWQKGVLRFSGCLLGATIGLFVIMLGLDSVFSMLFVTSCVVVPLAYIWGSRPGIAYLGAQACLAYLVTVVHDTGPMLSIAPPCQRLMGITLGVLFVWILNEIIWPPAADKVLK